MNKQADFLMHMMSVFWVCKIFSNLRVNHFKEVLHMFLINFLLGVPIVNHISFKRSTYLALVGILFRVEKNAFFRLKYKKIKNINGFFCVFLALERTNPIWSVA